MRNFIFLVVLLFAASLTAQNIKYARNTINTLCSDGYQGRGYVKNGDGKAAEFIYKELKKLKGFEVQYQPFAFTVNSFPSKMEVTVDGKKLKAGTDYMVTPECPTIKGSYKVIVAAHTIFETETAYKAFIQSLSTDAASYLVVIDTLPANLSAEASGRLKLLKTNTVKVAGFINLTNKKLMWSVGTEQAATAELMVADKAFDRQAKKIKLNITAELKPHSTNNVLGFIKGTENPDSIIVLSAHYDHLGRMGKKTIFPGANDNASGVAIMLDLANYYSQHPPKCSMLFIGFAAEEAGLIGSYYYVNYPVYPLERMKFLINLDLIGTGEKGIMAVNGLEFTPEYNALTAINTEKGYLSSVQARGKAANSDHYWFTEKGVRAFFFYLMGDFPYYHDPEDRAEILPLTEYEDTFRLIRDFMEYLQQ